MIDDFHKGRDKIDLSALGVAHFGPSAPADGTAWASAALSGTDMVVTVHLADGTTMTVRLTGFTGTLDASDFILAP